MRMHVIGLGILVIELLLALALAPALAAYESGCWQALLGYLITVPLIVMCPIWEVIFGV